MSLNNILSSRRVRDSAHDAVHNLVDRIAYASYTSHALKNESALLDGSSPPQLVDDSGATEVALRDMWRGIKSATKSVTSKTASQVKKGGSGVASAASATTSRLADLAGKGRSSVVSAVGATSAAANDFLSRPSVNLLVDLTAYTTYATQVNQMALLDGCGGECLHIFPVAENSAAAVAYPSDGARPARPSQGAEGPLGTASIPTMGNADEKLPNRNRTTELSAYDHTQWHTSYVQINTAAFLDGCGEGECIHVLPLQSLAVNLPTPNQASIPTRRMNGTALMEEGCGGECINVYVAAAPEFAGPTVSGRHLEALAGGGGDRGSTKSASFAPLAMLLFIFFMINHSQNIKSTLQVLKEIAIQHTQYIKRTLEVLITGRITSEADNGRNGGTAAMESTRSASISANELHLEAVDEFIPDLEFSFDSVDSSADFDEDRSAADGMRDHDDEDGLIDGADGDQGRLFETEEEQRALDDTIVQRALEEAEEQRVHDEAVVERALEEAEETHGDVPKESGKRVRFQSPIIEPMPGDEHALEEAEDILFVLEESGKRVRFQSPIIEPMIGDDAAADFVPSDIRQIVADHDRIFDDVMSDFRLDDEGAENAATEQDDDSITGSLDDSAAADNADGESVVEKEATTVVTKVPEEDFEEWPVAFPPPRTSKDLEAQAEEQRAWDEALVQRAFEKAEERHTHKEPGKRACLEETDLPDYKETEEHRAHEETAERRAIEEAAGQQRDLPSSESVQRTRGRYARVLFSCFHGPESIEKSDGLQSDASTVSTAASFTMSPLSKKSKKNRSKRKHSSRKHDESLPTPTREETSGTKARGFDTSSTKNEGDALNEGASSCECKCVSASFRTADDVEFFLPKLNMTCDCGKGASEEFLGDDPLDLENILRPWQVSFLASRSVTTAGEFIQAQATDYSISLCKAMKIWRDMKGMKPMKSTACHIALHIWAKTCKVILKLVTEQMSVGPEAVTMTPNAFLRYKGSKLRRELSKSMRGSAKWSRRKLSEKANED